MELETALARRLGVLPYPLQGDALRDIRGAAIAQGRAELLSLWAGQGAPLLRELPAAELLQTLIDRAQAAIDAERVRAVWDSGR